MSKNKPLNPGDRVLINKEGYLFGYVVEIHDEYLVIDPNSKAVAEESRRPFIKVATSEVELFVNPMMELHNILEKMNKDECDEESENEEMDDEESEDEEMDDEDEEKNSKAKFVKEFINNNKGLAVEKLAMTYAFENDMSFEESVALIESHIGESPVVINEDSYRNFMKKAPRGNGEWQVSSISDGSSEFSFNGVYSDAKKAIAVWAESRGFNEVFLIHETAIPPQSQAKVDSILKNLLKSVNSHNSGKMDADELGTICVTSADKIAKLPGFDKNSAKKVVDDFVDEHLK